MSSSNRQELVQNAVAFLADPKVAKLIVTKYVDLYDLYNKAQASPLTQRIQFLEAKGLTPQEIDAAFKQAALNYSGPSYHQPYPQSYGASPYPPIGAPGGQRWDWRDYFITAVISGSIAYGAVALFKKHLLPHLQPPTSTAYEEDRDALTAQFDAAEVLLKEIQEESAAVRKAVEEQKQEIDRTTANVEAVVVEMREGEHKTRDEMREIRDEVNNIREMLPKMINKNKESQAQSLSELQQELKSLKALLLSRGPSSIPSTPLPALGRPSIPAWQLASSPSQNGVEVSPSPIPSSQGPSPSVFTPIPISNGKERDPGPMEPSQ
ncbi:hypothetical protein DXG01_000156 [Tephrocybe rancida]|nr:hypothetical protein DXG01_000156 [Tephrocybe rancida]